MGPSQTYGTRISGVETQEYAGDSYKHGVWEPQKLLMPFSENDSFMWHTFMEILTYWRRVGEWRSQYPALIDLTIFFPLEVTRFKVIFLHWKEQNFKARGTIIFSFSTHIWYTFLCEVGEGWWVAQGHNERAAGTCISKCLSSPLFCHIPTSWKF